MESEKVLAAFESALEREQPNIVLVSTYLMYRDLCERMCALTDKRRIPVLLGGPYFAQPEIIAEWIRIPGVSALAAGEVELHVPEIVAGLLAGQDVTRVPGIFALDQDGGLSGTIAPPLRDLDSVPFPDFSDFPWSRYPNRIAPIATGRGCGWGVCTFCSDITSTAGRTFRSRSGENVLAELREHHKSFGVQEVVFTDLKLNSDLAVWRALLTGFQQAVPGGHWVAGVHVGQVEGQENGLSATDLRAAAASGCVRLTTGLETGSQRVADLMRKGTRIERTGEFLAAASAAGISPRCTMVLGYPGEEAQDVDASARFLREHESHIHRVSLNRFAMMTGTAAHRMYERKRGELPDISAVEPAHALGALSHHYDRASEPAYRRAVMRLLEAVHSINSRDLPAQARRFEGVM